VDFCHDRDPPCCVLAAGAVRLLVCGFAIDCGLERRAAIFFELMKAVR
jgi:hypothetical protein